MTLLKSVLKAIGHNALIALNASVEYAALLLKKVYVLTTLTALMIDFVNCYADIQTVVYSNPIHYRLAVIKYPKEYESALQYILSP